jgi:putative membrane protein
MRTKTILIIILTIIITVFLMINTDAVEFDFIFVKKEISKLVVVGVCTFIGFILGYWAAKPKTTVSSYDDELNDAKPTGGNDKRLSDEDRDYIS